MAELADKLSSERVLNIFGNIVPIIQMQSEAGVAGALRGAILGGSLCSTFTCSQGLLLMIPEMYKIAGEMLPAVIHISSRTVCSQAMNINSDHSDIMATRQAGWAILSSHSVQEAADFAVIAHASTIQSHIPFTHFFDGFRVSHEIQKIKLSQTALLQKMIDPSSLKKWRYIQAPANSNPVMRSPVEGIDEYMPLVEANNNAYTTAIAIVKDNLQKFASLTGRSYHLFDYYGNPTAEYLVVAMGTACKTFEEYISQSSIQQSNLTKFGFIAVHLFHPFSVEDFIKTIPDTCKHITIMDRTKEPGAVGEPLYLECLAVLIQSGRIYNQKDHSLLQVYGCRYGLGGRDITPTIAYQVYENMANTQGVIALRSKKMFTVGIIDDVTMLSLPLPPIDIEISHPGMTQALFYGFGADGTVGAVKDITRIIGNNTSLYVQAHFVHDAKKSGGLTISHLRLDTSPIISQYEIQRASYISCHHPTYIEKYDMLSHADPGAIFVLNCPWSDLASLEKNLPSYMKATISAKKLQLFTIDADLIARRCGLPGRINTILQTVFFYLSKVISPMDSVMMLQKDRIRKTYASKGAEIVEQNLRCIDEAIEHLHKIEIPTDAWREGTTPNEHTYAYATDSQFFNTIAGPSLSLQGKRFLVSDFLPYTGGIFPTATTQYEKRDTTPEYPKWDNTKCVQCNLCSFICPHAAIRPFIIRSQDLEKYPDIKVIKLRRSDSASNSGWFTIQVSPADCLGCKSCSLTCPTHALIMVDNHTQESMNTQAFFNTLSRYNSDELVAVGDPNYQNLQFQQPLFEFPGACAGCAESPIVRVITQLFGERLVIANTCGCSHVWGGTFPTSPYARHTRSGLGPTITGSLFEDTAEVGYGIARSGTLIREQLKSIMQELIKSNPETIPNTLLEQMQAWLDSFNDSNKSLRYAQSIVEQMKQIPANSVNAKSLLSEIWSRRDFLTKKSYWVIGGDGWAYDIDFGGLDHVLRSGANLNILVLDTEVYSNTGGQQSKATPSGAVTKFANAGKKTKKKDLGMYAVQIGSVYVATVARGANPQQLVKAISEAESFDGTSLVIALCPCVAWGLQKGQGYSILEEKKAVQCGYWPLYRYNPALKDKGLNPFHLDSPKPSIPVQELLSGENRFKQLMTKNPKLAAKLAEELQEDITIKYHSLLLLSTQ